MTLFFRVSSIVIAALFTLHMIGCTSSDGKEKVPVAAPDSVSSIDSKSELTESSLKVTDANFTKLVTESELPVVVYFWADWCPPCKWMAPIIEEVASENRETFRIAKLDSDRNPQTVRKYKTEALPTFIVFRDGKVIGRFVGGMQKTPFVQRIHQAINAQKD